MCADFVAAFLWDDEYIHSIACFLRDIGAHLLVRSRAGNVFRTRITQVYPWCITFTEHDGRRCVFYDAGTNFITTKNDDAYADIRVRDWERFAVLADRMADAARCIISDTQDAAGISDDTMGLILGYAAMEYATRQGYWSRRLARVLGARKQDNTK
jgi:hypothetical protein